MASNDLKKLVQAPASHSLVRQLLSVPASGKTIKVESDKKQLTIRVRPAIKGGHSTATNDK